MKMKNKSAQQRDDRNRHRENLRASRRSEPGLERETPSYTEKPTILIVCEGKNTEPSYFNQFRLASAKVVPIGEGYNTISLVNRAIELAHSAVYDQIWCVFDKDANSDYSFNEAIRLAEANKFGVAYSNQAFEYWLILHFLDHQGGGMNRGDYNQFDHKNPAKEESSTTVFRLVRELLKYGF